MNIFRRYPLLIFAVALVVIGALAVLLHAVFNKPSYQSGPIAANNIRFPRYQTDAIDFFTGNSFARLDLKTGQTQRLTKLHRLPRVLNAMWGKDGVLLQATNYADTDDLYAKIPKVFDETDEAIMWWYWNFKTDDFKPLLGSVTNPDVTGVAWDAAGSNYFYSAKIPESEETEMWQNNKLVRQLDGDYHLSALTDDGRWVLQRQDDHSVQLINPQDGKGVALIGTPLEPPVLYGGKAYYFKVLNKTNVDVSSGEEGETEDIRTRLTTFDLTANKQVKEQGSPDPLGFLPSNLGPVIMDDLGEQTAGLTFLSSGRHVVLKGLSVNNQSASALLHHLQSRLATDTERGFTSVGPHRDDFAFMLDGHPAANTASRGEGRTMVLMCKLLELGLLEEEHEDKPILLLDDVFSELDGSRRRALTEYLLDYQTVITTTDADAVLEHFVGDYHIIPTKTN